MVVFTPRGSRTSRHDSGPMMNSVGNLGFYFGPLVHGMARSHFRLRLHAVSHFQELDPLRKYVKELICNLLEQVEPFYAKTALACVPEPSKERSVYGQFHVRIVADDHRVAAPQL